MHKFTKLSFIWMVAVALTVGLLYGVPALADEENPATGPGYDQAQQELQAALDWIAANRTAVANDLAQRCAPAWDEEIDHVADTLAGLSDADLLAADEAPDCEAARSMIDGPPVELLGSTTQDFVFTAVNPCIIVDTRRSGAGGPIFANTQRNFQVFSGSLGSQGGNFCPLPSGKPEPSGVHINLISVPVSGGNGNIRAFPYLAPTADGLSVNFNSNLPVALANAGSIKSCVLCGPEITVRSNFATSHVKIEILGYYFPAEIPSNFASVDSENSVTSPETVETVVINAPSSGKVIVNASGYARFSTSGSDGGRCSITTGTTIDFAHLMIFDDDGGSGMTFMPFAGTRGFNVGSGNTTFRLVCDRFQGGISIGDPNMTAIFTKN